jgi:hypothetical protein
MSEFLEESVAVLSRTPATLDTLLRGLPEAWTEATEGPGTWSPYSVMGHLIHSETGNWIPRLEMILTHGTARAFEPLDRDARPESAPLPVLLDRFALLRRGNLSRLGRLNLQPAQLEMQGMHPELGTVTARQLISTWTAHDLAHTLQISRVMARRYREEVGPWAKYLSVMKTSAAG